MHVMWCYDAVLDYQLCRGQKATAISYSMCIGYMSYVSDNNKPYNTQVLLSAEQATAIPYYKLCSLVNLLSVDCRVFVITDMASHAVQHCTCMLVLELDILETEQ